MRIKRKKEKKRKPAFITVIICWAPKEVKSPSIVTPNLQKFG